MNWTGDWHFAHLNVQHSMLAFGARSKVRLQLGRAAERLASSVREQWLEIYPPGQELESAFKSKSEF